MDVLIAGGHGQVARRLIRLMAADGHSVRALIRNPDHAADIEADGGQPVLCDLPRDDGALVLLETLREPSTTRTTFELFAGDIPAREALRNLLPTRDL